MGNFKFLKTSIDGVIIVEPTVYGDSRGFFMETYQKEEFAAGGIDVEFVQDNQSMSKKGVFLTFCHIDNTGFLKQGYIVEMVYFVVFCNIYTV